MSVETLSLCPTTRLFYSFDFLIAITAFKLLVLRVKSTLKSSVTSRMGLGKQFSSFFRSAHAFGVSFDSRCTEHLQECYKK